MLEDGVLDDLSSEGSWLAVVPLSISGQMMAFEKSGRKHVHKVFFTSDVQDLGCVTETDTLSETKVPSRRHLPVPQQIHRTTLPWMPSPSCPGMRQAMEKAALKGNDLSKSGHCSRTSSGLDWFNGGYNGHIHKAPGCSSGDLWSSGKIGAAGCHVPCALWYTVGYCDCVILSINLVASLSATFAYPKRHISSHQQQKHLRQTDSLRSWTVPRVDTRGSRCIGHETMMRLTVYFHTWTWIKDTSFISNLFHVLTVFIQVRVSSKIVELHLKKSQGCLMLFDVFCIPVLNFKH